MLWELSSSGTKRTIEDLKVVVPYLVNIYLFSGFELLGGAAAHALVAIAGGRKKEEREKSSYIAWYRNKEKC